ncbi:hypothetical protein E4T38_03671 [Aureobasidium subglaciale]|nr:hypothetical protein E4T38_03671 [Aureobasidium subglaciale]KAI5224946.1 hypothetical protein E4T41_05419 [Aureobasidium subglaciale]KAI5225452.1 hypothetical protein E4T40_03446 [Aureobasidium subglaciale]KAI5261119.1 hypothetical protein E4T46_05312 [Aureobasidium subglaciale]
MASTRQGSISPIQASIFDPLEEEAQDDYHTEPTTAPHSGSGDEHEYYDLKPPPPSVSHSNMEHLSTRYFSVDHLNVILRDYQLFSRFRRFLTQYKPYTLPALESYVDTQKAVAAIEYANSLANNHRSTTGHTPKPAAVVDESFQERSRLVVQALVDDALPAYLTHRLVQTVTDSLVKEITGNNAPVMRDLIPSLAEVYCITDPSVSDNPIVYASEVRYFVGAQIDVTNLIEGGKGLDSFEKLLANDRTEERYRGRSMREPTQVLGELGQMMNDEELDAVNIRPRSQSRDTPPTASSRNLSLARPARKVFGMDDALERGLWPHPSLGPSGRLPGVYQNYLLVRPYPSLRITFTSPALRIPGLLQTKLMERLGGPQDVRDGVLDSLTHGTPVTAKISWLSTPAPAGSPHRTTIEGKPRWIHCTPLLGSDEQVGVWMIVMVEQEMVTGSLRRPSEIINTFPSPPPNVIGRSSLDVPVRGGEGARSPRFKAETGKLYADYLRREGKTPPQSEGHIGGPSRGSSTRETRTFQDF